MSNKPSSVTLEAFQTILNQRRSVRRFTAEKIPPAITEKCLEMATKAPNSSNLQPWHFYWVLDEEKKEALKKACLSQNAAKTAAELIVVTARQDTWQKHAKWVIANFPAEKVPLVVLDYYTKKVALSYDPGFLGIKGVIKKIASYVIGTQKPMVRGPFTRAAMKRWAVKSTALAADHLMLAFAAYGYDTCPMEGMDEYRVKKILGIGRPSEVVMVIAAGRRAENGVYHGQFRLPLEEVMTRV